MLLDVNLAKASSSLSIRVQQLLMRICVSGSVVNLKP